MHLRSSWQGDRSSIRLGRASDRATVYLPITLLIVLVATPVSFLLFGSFRSAGPGAPGASFTLSNWDTVLDSAGRNYLQNSLQLGITTSAVAVPLGTLMAWIISRTDTPGRRFFGSALLVPLLFSPLLTALAWSGIAAPNSGLINVIAREAFGNTRPIMDAYSFPMLVLVLSLHFTPYVYLAVRPALSAMDRDMEDASQILGARYGTTLRRVTLPLVLPAVLGSGILVAVLAAENFSAIAVLGVQSGFLTIPYGIYESFASFPSNPTRGGALGLLLLVVTVFGMSLYLWTIRKSTRYVTVSGKGSRSSLRQLSRAGRVVTFGILSLYLFISVVLPYAVLVVGSFSRYFTVENFTLDILTLQNYESLFASDVFPRAMGNTLVLVLIGASVAVLLGAFSGWIAVRGQGRAKKAVDYLSTMPIMIPGVALGLGMFWAYVFLSVPIYGTIGILAVAYVTRFMGHSTRIVSSSLLQISPQLEEAARTLGSTRIAAFRIITLRLLRSGMGAAWILIAIFISLEVPASILLYTGSSVPASIQVYLAMEGGVVSQAFAAGCVLATLSLAVTLLAQWRFRIFEHL